MSFDPRNLIRATHVITLNSIVILEISRAPAVRIFQVDYSVSRKGPGFIQAIVNYRTTPAQIKDLRSRNYTDGYRSAQNAFSTQYFAFANLQVGIEENG